MNDESLIYRNNKNGNFVIITIIIIIIIIIINHSYIAHITVRSLCAVKIQHS